MIPTSRDRLLDGLLAGEGDIAGGGILQQEAAAEGFNPNLWFDNMERVAAAKVGREHVRNIYNKYYVAYKLIKDAEAARHAVCEHRGDRRRWPIEPSQTTSSLP